MQVCWAKVEKTVKREMIDSRMNDFIKANLG